jgi:hypothetical protein
LKVTDGFLVHAVERFEKVARVSGSLKRRAICDATLQNAHRVKISFPNTGIIERAAHSGELIRNRLIAGPRELDAPSASGIPARTLEPELSLKPTLKASAVDL